MPRQPSLILQVLMLASLAIRLAVGAPCCWDGDFGQAEEHAANIHHAMDAADMAPMAPSGHEGHDDSDNTASPCCSACGPVLGNGAPKLVSQALAPPLPRLATLRDLPQRDLLRNYEATGPPSRV
ncbi:MAG: hypothetical protein P1U62_09615 [Alteraurantiacibacter sp. bin_em_oilr2.035]|nr:hypothetical protein [Alteraurantiacibacter sp. bin_em_oilr2.035]